MSVQTLAAEAEIDRKYLYQLEKRDSQPTLEKFLRLTHEVGADDSEMMPRLRSLVGLPPPRKQSRGPAPSAEQMIPLAEVTCPKCKAVYALGVRKLSARRQGKFQCGFCNSEISTWSGTTAFVYRVSRPPKNWDGGSSH
jgi:transcriptional regulator with XRE-family HTH domain